MPREKCRGVGSEPGAITLKQRDDLFRLLVERVKDYAIFLLDEVGVSLAGTQGRSLQGVSR